MSDNPYSKYGLNSNFQADDSLPAKQRYTNSLEFDQKNSVSARSLVTGRVRGSIIINDGQVDRVIIGKLSD